MSVNAKSTQEFVPIKEVRDGVILLKDGGLRAVLLATSINLSLKAYDEQKAIIMNFESFLNTLDFSTQIVIQSRRLDIRPYIQVLENRKREQFEPLLKIQTQEYINFIKKFTEDVHIMTKNFYIVVPYTQATLSTKKGFMSSIFPFLGKKNEAEAKQEAKADFEEKRMELEQRISVISQGLNPIGVKMRKLKSDEVIELFYKTFNPGEINTHIKLEGELNQDKKTEG